MDRNDIKRIIRKVPPFSWSGGYWRFGIIFTIYGYLSNLAVVLLVLYLGIQWQPLFFILTSYLAWSLKPLLIDRTRPCSDCPYTRKHDPQEELYEWGQNA